MGLNKKILTTEIVTVKNDLHNYSINGVWYNGDETLLAKGGGKGLKIYDDLEKDTHVIAVMRKRKLAVTAQDWEIVPASEDEKDIVASKFVNDVLLKLPFDKICTELLDAILKGFSVSEIIWKIEDGMIIPDRIENKDQRRFIFDKDKNLRLLTRSNVLTGDELPPDKFIVHTYNSKAGSPYGLGLGSPLFWAVFFKRHGITFWLNFAEKFGSPSVVGKYAPGTSKEDQNMLIEGLQNLSQNMVGIMPQGAEIEFLQAVTSGNTTYEQLATYFDKQISEAVLGETLSTDVGDTGSYAAAGVHNDVRTQLARADADLLSDTLKEYLFKPLIKFNFDGAKVPSIRRFIPIPENEKDTALNQKADVLTKLYNMGYEPEDTEEIDEIFGMKFKKVEKQVMQPSMSFPSFAEPENKNPSEDETENLLEQFDNLSGRKTDEWINTVKKMASECNDLIELRDKLLEVYKDIDVNELGDLMADVLEIAELKGHIHGN